MGRISNKRRGLVTGLMAAAVILTTTVIMDTNEGMKSQQTPLTVVRKQNETNLSKCDDKAVILSSKLDTRHPWGGDVECAKHLISHMVPYCRPPMALASFPGSGNTWMRYLIEGATAVFTGSRYKDLQIQMYGLWGEIRDWKDGTTVVQKTHDANQHHVQHDFGGRGILVLRNPYDAILSTHNFMYAGHHGRAPLKNYARKDWHQFVTVQTSKWLDMATNWTVHSDPEKVLVVHYEDVQANLFGEMRRISRFLKFPTDESRLQCLVKHRNGFFHRSPTKMAETVPFSAEIRQQMDALINHVNQHILLARGYKPMPLSSYNYYKKTDADILDDIRAKNAKLANLPPEQLNLEDEKSEKVDRSHGTKMVLKQYLKWLDNDEEHLKSGAEGSPEDDVKSLVMKHLFKKFRENSGQNTLTGLSQKAEGILSKAVELWPILQRPFARDPIEDAIETDGFRGQQIADIHIPTR